MHLQVRKPLVIRVECHLGAEEPDGCALSRKRGVSSRHSAGRVFPEALLGRGSKEQGLLEGRGPVQGRVSPLGKPVLCGPERGRAKEGGRETETERGGGGDVRGRQLRGGFALGGSRDALSTGVREA